MNASADTRRQQLSLTIAHQRQQRPAPLSSRPIKRQKKCQPENIFSRVQVRTQLKKDSDVRVSFFSVCKFHLLFPSITPYICSSLYFSHPSILTFTPLRGPTRLRN